MINLENKIEFGIDNLMWLTEVKPVFNQSIEDRYKVADIAAICKGSLHSVNSKKRFEHLLTESAGKAGRCLQFIPVKINSNSFQYGENFQDYLNNLSRFSFNKVNTSEYDTFGRLSITSYTNLRALLNYGVELKNIPFNSLQECEDFKIIVGFIPHYVALHLVTHTMITKIVESARKSVMSEVFYPTEDKHYKGKEITRMKLFACAAWKQDKAAWNNLIEVRSSNNTQVETKLVVENIKKLIYES